jgi:hypothetical protein
MRTVVKRPLANIPRTPAQGRQLPLKKNNGWDLSSANQRIACLGTAVSPFAECRHRHYATMANLQPWLPKGFLTPRTFVTTGPPGLGLGKPQRIDVSSRWLSTLLIATGAIAVRSDGQAFRNVSGAVMRRLGEMPDRFLGSFEMVKVAHKQI